MPNHLPNPARYQGGIRARELADTLEELSLKILGRKGIIESEERLKLVDELRGIYSAYLTVADYVSPERERITELYQRANTGFE